MDTLSGARRRRRWYLILMIAIILLVAAAACVWHFRRPRPAASPGAVMTGLQSCRHLFAAHRQEVTFVLHDDEGGVPTFFIFDSPSQRATAMAVNTLRGTPNARGVEIRFEAIRFRRDEHDSDRLWVRAVGIVKETEGKTPISLSALERGEPQTVHFHDEVRVPRLADVTYEVSMTIQYAWQPQQLTLSDAAGSIRWQMLGRDAFDAGTLAGTIHGRKADYPAKPLLLASANRPSSVSRDAARRQ